MVIITNLDGKSLPLIDIDFLSRTRGTNGDYQIKMVVRRTNKNAEAFKLIEEESIITLSDNNKFKIKDAEIETVNDVTKVELEAQHTFYDNVDNYVYDIIPGEKVLTLHQALTHALQDTNITFYIEDEFEKYSFEDFGDDTSIALFNKAKENFEFEFDIENNTHLRIYKQLGSKDKGIQMRWKQNIKTIKQSINTHNLATYIKGYGKPKEDKEGNVIEGEYVVEMDYTSPKADKYGIRHAAPYYNEKITENSTMLRYLKNQLIDYPEMEFEITYENLKNHINVDLEDAELGDTIYLIHEPMNLNFNVRILEVTDYPLHPHLKPIYTISSQPLDKMDKQTANAIDKANNDKEISTIKNKQTAAEKRIEKTIEAVADVENAMIDVEKEMDRIENEVIPEVEQAVDSARIPTSVEPPYPIPTSRLYWDSSHNPPILKRWTGTEWEVLAPTESEIDALMQQMRDEAIQEGKTYTDEEINATRNAITNKINDEIEAIEENYVDKQTYNNKIGQLDVSINDITGRVESTEVDFNDFKTGDYNLFKQQYGEFKLEMDNFTTKVGELSDIDGTLVDSFSQVRQEVGLIESTVRDVVVDVNGLEDSMTAVQTKISQLPSEINLAVSEGIDGLEIGGRNLIVGKSNVFDNSTLTAYDNFNLHYNPNQTVDEWGVRDAVEIRAVGGNYTSIIRFYKRLDNLAKTVEGETYTLSVYVKNMREYPVSVDAFGLSGTPGVTLQPYEAKRIVLTGKRTATHLQIRVKAHATNANVHVILYQDQLEKGNKATDWSPAPEDQVNKTNVLSSINLSTEGVKIQGNKIDIKGLVTVLNADGTPGTMINGGKIAAKSITANQLNINNIFGNSAVIDKIQADIVRTSELDAEKITSGEMSGARIQAGTLSATKITSGNLDASKVNVLNLNASNIKTGTLNAIDITSSNIHGGTLNALNNSTQFNLNTGNLDFYSNSSIRFNNSGGGIKRVGTNSQAFVSYAISSGGTTPMVSVGSVNNTGTVNVNDTSFTGVRIHSNRSSLENDLVGSVWAFKRTVSSTDAMFVVDLSSSRKTIRPQYAASTNYDLGSGSNYFDRVYAQEATVNTGNYTIINNHERTQGFRMMVGYQGENYLSFYGLNAGPGWINPRYYALGKSSNRFSQIFLLNEPNVNSDARLKENIVDNTLGLNFINDLRTVTYNLKNGPTKPRNYGVLAQEVESVLQAHGVDTDNISLVEKDDEGYYSMQPSQLVFPTIKAIQELSDENEQLKQDYNELLNRVEQLEQLLA